MKSFMLISKRDKRLLTLVIVPALVVGVAYWVFVVNDGGTNDVDTGELDANRSNSNSTDLPINYSGESQEANTSNEILPAPVLNKSSGNNGSIPSGMLVNFTCSGVINADCQIILTDLSSSKTVELKKQALKTIDRGSSSATWTWKSISGNWDVKAIASSTGYTSSESKPQELTVE